MNHFNWGKRMSAGSFVSSPFPSGISFGHKGEVAGDGEGKCVSGDMFRLVFPHPHPSPPLEGEGVALHAIAVDATVTFPFLRRV
jgi:hypothetical protein